MIKKQYYLLLVVLITILSEINAQHQHGSDSKATADSPPVDKLNHTGINTSLPVSRLYAATHVKSTGKKIIYDLTIYEQIVNITGKPTKAITINGAIPGPTLTFTEGDTAEIKVHNKLKVETSTHWHGILLPNREDGVSYLTTPPIKAGQTYTFKFPLVQTGTYWFHSHSGFQEQKGVFGSIVIHPKQPDTRTNKELVVILSDWTNENTSYILKNLKRENEWYAIKKGNAQSLNRIIRHKAIGPYLKQSFNRMSPMDISDIYYERFLINGKDTSSYENLLAGDKVRIRVINASASTYQHINFAGGEMIIVAADGLEVQPVKVDRILLAVAETYDVIVTIPEDGSYEFRSTSQDGTGYATAWLGKGKRHYAKDLPKPDLYKMTKDMNSMNMGNVGEMFGKNARMGKKSNTAFMNLKASYTPYDEEVKGNNSGMKDSDMKPMPADHSNMNMKKDSPTKPEKSKKKKVDHSKMNMDGMDMGENSKPIPADHSKMNRDLKMNDTTQKNKNDVGDKKMESQLNQEGNGMENMKMVGMNMLGEDNSPNYAQLKSIEKIEFPRERPFREYSLTLSGDMRRYIWGINGRTLSQDEDLLIKRGEIVRFKITNGTMMLHPMHLHGHFFRVINGQGKYSPLKHTVNVSPMETVVIEFLADEEKDWFFHCHLLYHMATGMGRVIKYENSRTDPDMTNMHKLHRKEMNDNKLYFWGRADLGYPTSYLLMNLSNNKNAVIFGGDVNRNGQFEIDLDYERYLNQYFRLFGGIDAGNEKFLRVVKENVDKNVNKQIIRPVAGIRYLLPFLIDSEIKVDILGNVRFQLSGEQKLFPRLIVGYEAQYLVRSYTRLRVDLDYILTKNFALFGNYDTRYNTLSGGIAYRF